MAMPSTGVKAVRGPPPGEFKVPSIRLSAAPLFDRPASFRTMTEPIALAPLSAPNPPFSTQSTTPVDSPPTQPAPFPWMSRPSAPVADDKRIHYNAQDASSLAVPTAPPPPSRPPSVNHHHTLSAPHLSYSFDGPMPPHMMPLPGSASQSYDARAPAPIYQAPYPPEPLHRAGHRRQMSYDTVQDPQSQPRAPESGPVTHRRGASLGGQPYPYPPGPYQSHRRHASMGMSSVGGDDDEFEDDHADGQSFDFGQRDAAPGDRYVPGMPPGGRGGLSASDVGSLEDLRDGPEGPNARPGYAYVTLIRFAILGSPHKRLTLGEIYEALERRFPYYRTAGKGWRNSVRHNLSLNKCFKREARHILDPGKGSYWRVDLNEEPSTSRVRTRKKAAPRSTTSTSGSVPEASPQPYGGHPTAPRPLPPPQHSPYAYDPNRMQQQQHPGQYAAPPGPSYDSLQRSGSAGRESAYQFPPPSMMPVPLGPPQPSLSSTRYEQSAPPPPQWAQQPRWPGQPDDPAAAWRMQSSQPASVGDEA